MKGKVATVALAVLAVCCAPTFADYQSIQHNLINGVGDTTFNATTGVFNVSANTRDLLTLNDPTALGGAIQNTVINLSTTFNQILPGPVAQFVGGSLSLTFDYDDGGGFQSYEISGPITGMLFEINAATPSKIDGLGRWTATTVNLPGSNVWPDGGGFSSVDSLTFAFGQDLSNFDWREDLTGRVETLYSLFPDDRAVPEPATLALLAFGALALARKRR